MNARLLIEENDLKSEMLADTSIQSILTRHGLVPGAAGHYERRGWNDNMATVYHQQYDGLTIPMAPAPEVQVVVLTYITPAWQNFSAQVILEYGSKSRKVQLETQGDDEGVMVTKLDLKLTKLKKRLKLYKPRTERGLDTIIRGLGYS